MAVTVVPESVSFITLTPLRIGRKHMLYKSKQKW